MSKIKFRPERQFSFSMEHLADRFCFAMNEEWYAFFTIGVPKDARIVRSSCVCASLGAAVVI